MGMVNIRMEDELKAEADSVFRELNVSATEAVTLLYHHAADVATALNKQHHRNGFISTADRDAARAVFDGTVRSLEDNYDALQSACGGYLQQAWVNAANAMKGLLWMVSLCTEAVAGGVVVNAELDRATRALSDSFIDIDLLTDKFDPLD